MTVEKEIDEIRRIERSGWQNKDRENSKRAEAGSRKVPEVG
jgi:hypothetical protein